MDVMLGSPHYGDLDDDIRNEFANDARNNRPSSSQESEIRSENRCDGHMQPSITENIERRLENITNEMNARLSHELDGLMFTLNTQIQRAIDIAVTSQLIAQIQSSIRPVNGEGPSERPDVNAEGLKTAGKSSSSRNDVSKGYNPNESMRTFI